MWMANDGNYVSDIRIGKEVPALIPSTARAKTLHTLAQAQAG